MTATDRSAARDEPRVVTLGETMALVAPIDGLPLEATRELLLDIGGAESNLASHLVRHGLRARWLSAVGDDALGRRLLATLAERGVDVDLVRVDPSAPTGLFLKDPHPEGTRVIYHRAGSAASRLGPDLFDDPEIAATVDRAELVHLSGITPALSPSCRALVEAVLDRRDAAGRPVSFDVNYRPALWPVDQAGPVLRALAARAAIVFVGRDEAEVLWGRGDLAGIRELLPDTRLVIKDGAVAAHHVDHSGWVSVPSPVVEVVEPVGAGDAFAAGFLAADLGGATAAEALAAGHASAAVALRSAADF